MIRKLLICNYALIERMEIAFEPGLSVITGETGAGKSIIWVHCRSYWGSVPMHAW